MSKLLAEPVITRFVLFPLLKGESVAMLCEQMLGLTGLPNMDAVEVSCVQYLKKNLLFFPLNDLE